MFDQYFLRRIGTSIMVLIILASAILVAGCTGAKPSMVPTVQVTVTNTAMSAETDTSKPAVAIGNTLAPALPAVAAELTAEPQIASLNDYHAADAQESKSELTQQERKDIEALVNLCLNAIHGGYAQPYDPYDEMLSGQAVESVPPAAYVDLLLQFVSLYVQDGQDYLTLAEKYPIDLEYSYEDGLKLSTDTFNCLLRSCFPGANAESIRLNDYQLPFLANHSGGTWAFSDFEADGGGLSRVRLTSIHNAGQGYFDVFLTKWQDYDLGDSTGTIYLVRVKRDDSSIFSFSATGFRRIENEPVFTAARASSTLQDKEIQLQPVKCAG